MGTFLSFTTDAASLRFRTAPMWVFGDFLPVFFYAALNLGMRH
jgi:hypothetical protein